MLSVVIPAYNEQETVAAAAEEIGRVLFAAEIPHELIFIDDGSRGFPGISARRPRSLPDSGRREATASP